MSALMFACARMQGQRNGSGLSQGGTRPTRRMHSALQVRISCSEGQE